MEIAKKILKITPLFLLLTAAFFCFAQEGEKITITTYYPSPYGVYNDLKTKKLVVGDIEDSSPEEGVIKFEPLSEKPAGGEGGLYFDSIGEKFQYHDGDEWNDMMPEAEGRCAWFRSALGCPKKWENQEDSPIVVNDFPAVVKGYKAIVYHWSSSGFHYGCRTDASCTWVLPHEGWGGEGPADYCRKCFGDTGFIGLEYLPSCGVASGSTFSHVHCLYEEDPPTPSLIYKLYYCCPLPG